DQVIAVVLPRLIGRMAFINECLDNVDQAHSGDDMLSGPPRLACRRIVLRHIRLRDPASGGLDRTRPSRPAPFHAGLGPECPGDSATPGYLLPAGAALLTRLTSSTGQGNSLPFCLTTTNPSLSPAAAVTFDSF